jgi:hypothetical protein
VFERRLNYTEQALPKREDLIRSKQPCAAAVTHAGLPLFCFDTTHTQRGRRQHRRRYPE